MNNKINSTICLSGAFDILHIGHIHLFEAASYFGEIIIILNSDEWVKNNREFLVMPWGQRRNILLSLKGIDSVVSVDDSDGTVCSALIEISPRIFGNGGNRTEWNTPERKLCLDNDIKLVYGLGGGEADQVSLELRKKIKNIS